MAPRANGNTAPVCPVSRNEVLPGMPGIMLPYVPKAVDLPSAIAAANQAAQLLQTLAGPVGNNIGGGGGNPAGGYYGVRPQTVRWREKERHTATIRYYAKNATTGDYDFAQWLEVDRIVYIKWHDKVQKIDLIAEWVFRPEPGKKLMKIDGGDVNPTDPRTFTGVPGIEVQ
jgi:hypothetical protein